jgi:hypothetical protein
MEMVGLALYAKRTQCKVSKLYTFVLVQRKQSPTLILISHSITLQTRNPVCLGATRRNIEDAKAAVRNALSYLLGRCMLKITKTNDMTVVEDKDITGGVPLANVVEE